jgi:hypothetical protein
MTDLSQTTLDQIIRINERGNIANAVNFGMMTDPDQNLALCESFVFNYNAKKPEQSSVGLLDIIRESFHSNNTPNIHLIVQQFGKGKSHFAVTAANFFSQRHDSDEVLGILHQLQNATGEHSGVFERLKHFKTDRRYLTLCLSGDRDGDLRKLILNTLLENLEREGIQDSIGHQICRAPLHYLEQLDDNNRHKADRYLESLGNPDGDLKVIIDALKNNEPNSYALPKTSLNISPASSPTFRPISMSPACSKMHSIGSAATMKANHFAASWSCSTNYRTTSCAGAPTRSVPVTTPCKV